MNVLRKLNNKLFLNIDYLKQFYLDSYYYFLFCICLASSSNGEHIDEPCVFIEVRRKFDDKIVTEICCFRNPINNYFQVYCVDDNYSLSVADYVKNKYLPNDLIIYCKSKLCGYEYGKHIGR